MRNELYHARSHKYIRKERSSNGKYRYYYTDTSGSNNNNTNLSDEYYAEKEYNSRSNDYKSTTRKSGNNVKNTTRSNNNNTNLSDEYYAEKEYNSRTNDYKLKSGNNVKNTRTTSSGHQFTYDPISGSTVVSKLEPAATNKGKNYVSKLSHKVIKNIKKAFSKGKKFISKLF